MNNHVGFRPSVTNDVIPSVNSLSLCLQMLYACFWMLLFVSFTCVNSLRGFRKENNVTCNVTSVHDNCPLFDKGMNPEDLYEEATKISHCMNTTQHEVLNETGTNLSGSVKCLIRDVERNIANREENFTEIRQMFLNAELEMTSDNSQQRDEVYSCFYCVISGLNFVLNSLDPSNTSDTKSPFFGAEDFEIIRKIFTIILYMNVPKSSADVTDKNLLDADTWEKFFITLTNDTLDTAEIRKEVDKVIRERGDECVPYDRVKNCGFCSECRLRPILWTLYVAAIVVNGLLIFIFIRHREIRTDRNTIILNLAVADILAVLSNGSLQIIFVYGGTFDNARIYYRVMDTCLEVTTGVCIYSIVGLSVQRYCAVVPSYKRNECGLSRCFNSALFVCVLWIAGCVPKVIEFSFNMGLRAWAMRNLVLYCVLPAVCMATFYVMTSWRLKQSVRKIPGEAVRHGTARNARVRSSNVLIALVAVFVVSYAPIQLFRFIELWFYGGGYLFDYVDVIAYSMLSLNSFFNPVALYVASGTFRKYYNRYIRCGWNSDDVNVSNPNTNNQCTKNTYLT